MVLCCLWGVQVLLVTALCEGGYRWGFALCGVWLWSVSLWRVGLRARSRKFFFAVLKSRKRVFSIVSINLKELTKPVVPGAFPGVLTERHGVREVVSSHPVLVKEID